MSKVFISVIFLALALISCSNAKDSDSVSPPQQKSAIFVSEVDYGCGQLGHLTSIDRIVGLKSITVCIPSYSSKPTECNDAYGLLLTFDSGKPWFFEINKKNGDMPSDMEEMTVMDQLTTIISNSSKIYVKCRASTSFSPERHSDLLFMNRSHHSAEENEESDVAGFISISRVEL